MPKTYKPGQLVDINPRELTFNKVNREPDARHVQKLKRALMKDNLLHLDPIKITPNLEIIDGQHRVKAAIELDYKVVPAHVVPANVHAAQTLNALHKNWDLMDKAHYWAQMGKKDYADFIEFVQLTALPPSIALEVISSGGGRASDVFTSGGFRLREGAITRGYKFIELLEDFKTALPNSYRSRPFTRAFYKVFSHKNQYDHARLLHKVGLVGLRPGSTMEWFLEQLEEVYNWKVKLQEEKVRFTE